MEADLLSDMFQPYTRLIEIEVCGEKRLVPENNTILRCFQYLNMEAISYGDFCWNGECLNCQVWLRVGEKDKAVIACRMIVAENMKIVRLADGIILDES